jgi:hypothetical protein
MKSTSVFFVGWFFFCLKMKELYLQLSNGKHVYVYMNIGKNGRHGIGFTKYHRSCLVVRIHEGVLYIEGLSTRRRDQVLKNPLGLPRHGKHLREWLYIAEAYANYHGIPEIRLYDAANVYVENRYYFLSCCTLLRDNQFLYEKYGFQAPECSDVRNLLQKTCPSDIPCNDLILRNVLRRSTSWPEVYARLVRQNRPFLCEELFESLGFQIKDLQFWYTKSVGPCPVQIEKTVDISLPWYHSDRWMDVD